MINSQDIQNVKNRFGIIGVSPTLNHAIDIAIQVAKTDLSVLIQGESGVGKEFFPKIIHQYSNRKHNALIAVNCGAIPEGTIDSELFGHVKGSFTSATSDRKGYFEEADGGTIFLDEVGELPLSTQVRLLRVLESGEFIRVGSSKVQKTNVRVVAATNVNMLKAISTGRFREDLYYRLNAVPINIPPLRDRKSDITLLFRKFASDLAEKYNMPPVKLTPQAESIIENYEWRGNIRQLKNIAEQISILEQNREINAETIKNYLPYQNNLPATYTFGDPENGGFKERDLMFIIMQMKKEIDNMKEIISNYHIDSNKNNPEIENTNKSMIAIDNEKETISTQDTPYIIDNTTRNNFEENKIETNNKKKDISYIDEITEIEEQPITLAEQEKKMIIETYNKTKLNLKETARILGVSTRTIYRKLEEYGIDTKNQKKNE
ncbi:MAG: sigma-54 interaction domain-containing protein [Candidatus Aphodosoma sp.]